MTQINKKSHRQHESRFVYALAIICMISICFDTNHPEVEAKKVEHVDIHIALVSTIKY